MSALPALSRPVVAIVGATGAVGLELIRCLEQRRFPLAELRLFASARSAGKTLMFRGVALAVRELTEIELRRGWTSRCFPPAAALPSALRPLRYAPAPRWSTTPRSSAWTQACPLVVPEINPQAMRTPHRHHRQPQLLRHHLDHAAVAHPQGQPHRAAADGDLPGGLRCRRRRHGGTARVHACVPGRAQLRQQGAAAPLRVQPLQPQHQDRPCDAATTKRRSRSSRRRARSSATRRSACRPPACACRYCVRTPWQSPSSASVRSRRPKCASCCKDAPGVKLVDDPSATTSRCPRMPPATTRSWSGASGRT